MAAAARFARRRPLALVDEDGFADAYDEHSGDVFNTAYRVLGDVAKAQDVTHDVFLRLWRDPSRFDARRGALGPYLRLLARSRALDAWREAGAAGRAHRRLEGNAHVAAHATADERPPAALERAEDGESVRRALARLPAEQREALVLAYWGEMTAEQVARHVGIPLGTAKSRLRLGLSKLRAELEPAPPHLPAAA